jgi:hypothetical protein
MYGYKVVVPVPLGEPVSVIGETGLTPSGNAFLRAGRTTQTGTTWTQTEHVVLTQKELREYIAELSALARREDGQQVMVKLSKAAAISASRALSRGSIHLKGLAEDAANRKGDISGSVLAAQLESERDEVNEAQRAIQDAIGHYNDTRQERD